MILEAYVENDKIIVPNVFKTKRKKIKVSIEIINENNGKDIDEKMLLRIEHHKKKKRREISLNLKKIEEYSKKLNLKGITVEDLINENIK